LIDAAGKSYDLDAQSNEKKEQYCKWSFKEDYRGIQHIKITFNHIIKSVVWHSKGDYFSTMAHNI
jgi:hypothetical protein